MSGPPDDVLPERGAQGSCRCRSLSCAALTSPFPPQQCCAGARGGGSRGRHTNLRRKSVSSAVTLSTPQNEGWRTLFNSHRQLLEKFGEISRSGGKRWFYLCVNIPPLSVHAQRACKMGKSIFLDLQTFLNVFARLVLVVRQPVSKPGFGSHYFIS